MRSFILFICTMSSKFGMDFTLEFRLTTFQVLIRSTYRTPQD